MEGKKYKSTLYASYIGYITQAIINNLSPLLFVTYQREFSISLKRISLLILINFGTQIITDLVAAKYVDKIGYRKAIILAHSLSVLGLIGLGTLPFLMSNPYAGLILATLLNAVGGGLIEVLISPIVEALPGDEKASAMSLLHSFYCWGQVGVVLLSTLYFSIVGMNNWKYLTILWAMIPFLNIFLFAKVPLCTLVEEEERLPLKQLFKVKIFWILFLLMICAGASELAMSQWSSLFAETGLNVSKQVGDLLGPCAFAVLMGLSRVFYGIRGSKIDLWKALIGSGILCIVSYAAAVFSPWPLLSLFGCALCGLSVGMMWPGTFSLASESYKNGGTAMFAVLALAGDIGCSAGPGLVGLFTNLKTGLLMASIFPLLLVFGIFLLKRERAD